MKIGKNKQDGQHKHEGNNLLKSTLPDKEELKKMLSLQGNGKLGNDL